MTDTKSVASRPMPAPGRGESCEPTPPGPFPTPTPQEAARASHREGQTVSFPVSGAIRVAKRANAERSEAGGSGCGSRSQ
jgi:hypothetical protein